ncbi:MAG: hypothetical protein J0J01_09925 [Reyranella sp.]|nr:hypothetical protein [Reyranella sp.]
MRLLIPFRFLISPLSIAAINLLILWPLVLSVVDLIESIRIHRDFNEAVDTVSTIAIVLIGWGVALEERNVLRGVFKMAGRPDERWQHGIDEACHRSGVGVLILGLFAEVCSELIHLPNRIIDTAGREYPLLAVGTVLLSLGGLILVRLIIQLIGSLGVRRDNPRISPEESH